MTSPPPLSFPSAFDRLTRGTLGLELARQAFDTILTGGWTPVQIAAFLAALAIRGEDAATIAGAAQSMRAAMLRVPHSQAVVLDTCGTGGDGSGTVNLSTGAAIIAAACGVTVAKHGNRAVSSRAGSADVLEALGIRTQLPASAAPRLLDELHLAFLLAPTFHPAMRFAVPVRKELGVRTLFNVLGPLCNPAGATHQLLGAFDDALRPVLANTLQALGTQRAWVVRGRDGLDELSPYGPTLVTELAGGVLTELEVGPGDFGLPVAEPGSAAGGDAAENAGIIEAVLNGEAHPARSAFLLNAAGALVVAQGLPPREASAAATKAVDSGAAALKLAAWREHSTRAFEEAKSAGESA